MQCLILAGGLATRMRPITEKIPKALIPTDEHPFVHHQLRWLASHGVTEAVFSIGYKGEMIRDYVGDGSRYGLRARYVDEGTELKGTAGAIRLAHDQGVLDEAFLVTYGDSFLAVDFAEIFQGFLRRPEPALMTAFRNEEQWEVSNICFEGTPGHPEGRVTLYDKWIQEKPAAMRWVDFGLSALRRSVVAKEIEAGKKADLAEVFHRLSIRGELAGWEVRQRFYEIGSPAGLEDFKAFLAKGLKL